MNKRAFVLSKERVGLSWLDWLFVGGDVCMLLSVFFVWRQTHIANQADVFTTAWQLGFVGGQGMFFLALLLLLLFGAGMMFFKQLQQRLVNVFYACVLLVCFVLLTKQVLSFYPSHQTVLRSTLGLGFYVAIVGCNLLIFYCIFLFKMKRTPQIVGSPNNLRG